MACGTDPSPTNRSDADGSDTGASGLGGSGAGGNETTCQDDSDGALCQVNVGVGTPNVFDPNADNSNGVTTQDGAVVLTSRSLASHFIWIANTGEGSVSKFDTRTFEELGRYMTGPAGTGNDPSRTSVNSFGDVYVGNRNGASVTRISVLGEMCEDHNQDGASTTSDGTSMLPWGEDDCVMWHTNLGTRTAGRGRVVRAVAAQDVEQADGTVDQFVWVGAHEDRRVFKLNGLTGEVLFHVDVPIRPYGFALDGKGQLWIASQDRAQIASIDTNNCSAGACSAQVVRLPSRGYGITVDTKQRIWIGGPFITRYTPETGEIVQEPAATGAMAEIGGMAHGIAADANGWIWAAGFQMGVIRLNADNPSERTTVRDTSGYENKGVAVDTDGKIWSIARTQSRAIVMTPGPGLNDVTVNPDVATSIKFPYTYSDMTGVQLMLATGARTLVVPLGSYRRVLQGCDAQDPTDWRELEWDAETPTGTSISFRFRIAATEADLVQAEWLPLATVPPDSPPVSIQRAIENANQSGDFLELEASLRSMREGPSNLSPRLNSFGVSYACPRTLN